MNKYLSISIFAIGPENIFLQSQKVPIIAIIIDMNLFSMERDMKESNPSECSRKNLEYMYKLLISNNFIPFSLVEREATLHKLDVNKDLRRLSNNTNVWLNGLIFVELSNNQEAS